MRRLCFIALAAAACTGAARPEAPPGPADMDATTANAGMEAASDEDAPGDAGPTCTAAATFSSCDGGADASGACLTDPPWFDGGGDAAYPVGCFILMPCAAEGCWCSAPLSDAAAYWSCTLR